MTTRTALATLSIAALALLDARAAVAQSGAAQPAPLERAVTVALGQEVQLSVVSNSKEACTGLPVPELRIVGAPARGTLTVRFVGFRVPSAAPRCGDKQLPALALYYRPAEDTPPGTDATRIKTAVGTARALRNFTITVTR